jgi:hydroxymethylbilane synthase
MMRLGTRSSALALAQARAVADDLRRGGAEVELVPMKTEGDRLLGARLADVGGKGLFVREIEEALATGTIDLAVHSLKDLPADLPDGLELAAFPERNDPRDVLVTRTGGGLDALRPGALVGSASLRRRALVLSARPDVRVEPVRGNVDTRLRKLESGDWDAILLAAAGLARLGLRPAHVAFLSSDVFVPAVGQAIIGVEIRRDDRRARAAVECLDHRATHVCALAERAYLRRLGASCTTPMAAHAVLDGTRLRMAALVASEDGRKVLRAEAAGAAEDAETMGRGLAESLLAQGAAEVAGLDPGRWTA